MESERIITIISAPKDHGFKNFAEARRWAKESIVGIVGKIHVDRNGNENLKDIVRLYGAIKICGIFYRVKTTVKRYTNANERTKAYSYEVKEIELLDGTPGDDHNNPLPRTSNNSITVAKLLQISEFDNNND